MPYVFMWEFEVRPEHEAAFREAYGPDGAWVALFRQAPGFVSTDLYRDRDRPLRFLTVDTWESEAAHDAFRRRFGDAYAQLDAAGARLTRRETPLGRFDRL
jgi:quinol monooxygenase YgiN